MYYQIFGNIFIISKPTYIEFNGKFKEFKLSVMSNIWCVSLILDGSSLAISWSTFSTKIESFSMAVLQPLVITLVGLSILSVLHYHHLPKCQIFHRYKFLPFFPNAFISYHFSTQLLSYFSWVLIGFSEIFSN